jgi:sphingomyelin phosphodiesterase 2
MSDLSRGLKFISKDRKLRFRAIADELANSSPGYDVIALQEVWVRSDFEAIRVKLAATLPFSKFFYAYVQVFLRRVVVPEFCTKRVIFGSSSVLAYICGLLCLDRGALGSGVAIISRFPIIESSSFSYSHNGSPIDVGSGDWIVGKGLFSVVLSHPILQELEVFSTHVRFSLKVM